MHFTSVRGAFVCTVKIQTDQDVLKDVPIPVFLKPTDSIMGSKHRHNDIPRVSGTWSPLLDLHLLWAFILCLDGLIVGERFVYYILFEKEPLEVFGDQVTIFWMCTRTQFVHYTWNSCDFLLIPLNILTLPKSLCLNPGLSRHAPRFSWFFIVVYLNVPNVKWRLTLLTLSNIEVLKQTFPHIFSTHIHISSQSVVLY